MDPQLLADAKEGRLTKQELADLLPVDRRGPFLKACAAIEKQYTEACTAKQDPCLESGCALDGETCLQPLLNAGSEYQKACGAAWLRFAS